MKIDEMLMLIEGLRALSEKQMKASVSYKIMLTAKKLEPEQSTFEKKREELFKKYGEETEGKYEILDENKEAFQKEFSDLIATEVDVVLPEIKLEDIADVEIEPKVLYQVSAIIKE